jgi:hypothetical protein
MATFKELSQANYYIIQENENGSLDLVFVPLITGKCIMLEFQDEDQTTVWRRLTDNVHEIVEKLTVEQAIQYENYKSTNDFGEAEEEDDWLEEEEEADDADLWDEENDDLDFLSKN